MKMCARRRGCGKLDGHGSECARWDAEAQTWRPLPPTEAERRHGEAVRAETARQEARHDDREEVAELIARAIRAGRYSGRMIPERLPVADHNPVDLRDGRRVYDELCAAGVIR